MKKLLRLTVLFTLLTLLYIDNAPAQNTPPFPPPSQGTGGNKGPSDGGAKLGDGAWILVAFVISYGVHTYSSRKKHEPQDE